MRYVIVRADGGISVLPPVSEDATALDIFRKWAASARVEWLPARMESTAHSLPDQLFHGSRMLRGPRNQPKDNAWVWDDAEKRVVIAMDHARDCAREKLRALRAPLLKDLDVEYQRADEAGDAARKADIAARKNALRGITDDPRIAAATTPDELKEILSRAL